MLNGEKTVSEENVEEAIQLHDLLEKLLEKNDFIAGQNVTVADFSVITDLTCLNVFVPLDEEQHPRLAGWMKKIQELPCYQAGVPGLKSYEEMVRSKMEVDATSEGKLSKGDC